MCQKITRNFLLPCIYFKLLSKLSKIFSHIKLCDFNISGQLIDSIAASTTRGAFCYLAPERIQHQQYGAKADVWSLGMTLVHLAQGKENGKKRKF